MKIVDAKESQLSKQKEELAVKDRNASEFFLYGENNH